MINLDEITYEEARELKLQLESFFQHAGWDFTKKLIAARVEARQQELYSICPGTIEQMCGFNRIKGGLEELQLLPVIMEQVLEDLTNEINRITDEEEESEQGIARQVYPVTDGEENE